MVRNEAWPGEREDAAGHPDGHPLLTAIVISRDDEDVIGLLRLVRGAEHGSEELRVARGERFTLQQSDIRFHGHAIEARVLLERVFELAPWIFLWFPVDMWAARPELEGWTFYAVFTGQRWDEVRYGE